MKRNYANDFSGAYFRMVSSNMKKGIYPLIGKGSGRIVYDLENGQIIKAAKNKKGFAQNFEEYRIAFMNHTDLLARVYDVSEDYRYLVMDKAEPIDNISTVWDHFGVSSNEELFQACGLRDISEQYNLMIWDFGRPANWGIIESKPMIIDYGFTRRVRRKYY